MSAFKTLIVDEVRRRGHVPFREYMAWALHHPWHGYNAAARPLIDGSSAAAVGGLFCDAFLEMWNHLGSGRLTLVEVGARDGALAEKILIAFAERGRAAGLTYYIVEESPAARAAARRRLSRFPKLRIVESLEALEHTAGLEGCVFSVGHFGALPFHRLVGGAGGVPRELHVASDGNGLRALPGDLTSPRLRAALAEDGAPLAEGQSRDVSLSADDEMAELARVLSRGFVVVLEAGASPSTDDPFAAPGEAPLAAPVDFGRLARAGEKNDFLPLVYADAADYARAFEKDAAAVFDGRRALVLGKNVGRPALRGGAPGSLDRLKAGA